MKFYWPFRKPEVKRRVKKIVISADDLLRMFADLDGKRILTVNGLPEDAKAVGLHQSQGNWNSFVLYIASETFPEVEDGRGPDNLLLTVTTTVPDPSTGEWPMPYPEEITGYRGSVTGKPLDPEKPPNVGGINSK